MVAPAGTEMNSHQFQVRDRREPYSRTVSYHYLFSEQAKIAKRKAYEGLPFSEAPFTQISETMLQIHRIANASVARTKFALENAAMGI